MDALALPSDFLEQAARAGLRPRPVHNADGRLAYHPLVREFLLDRLELERDGEVVRDLNARVAAALAASGRVGGRDPALDRGRGMGGRTRQHRRRRACPPPQRPRHGPGLARCAAGRRSARPPPALYLQGALDWAAGRQAEAVERLRASARRFAEAGDVPGMWLARFTLADPLFVTGAMGEVAELAEGFDDESALAAGLAPPALAAYSAAALGALGRIARMRGALAAARRSSPFRLREAAQDRLGVLRAPARGRLRRARPGGPQRDPRVRALRPRRPPARDRGDPAARARRSGTR